MKRVMLALVGWTADLRLENVADPEPPARDQVVVAVEACGVCYRDLIDRDGRFPFLQLPITPGHEAVGRVVAVGPEAREWSVGDRLATMLRDFCGACAACREGETSLCQSASWVFGLTAPGGYASFVVAPERAFYPVPGELPPELAAVLACTFGVAYRGLNRFGRVAPGMRVLVTGANGGVGSAAVQVALRQGAEVTAVVRADGYADWLTALGAAEVIVSPQSDFHRRTGPTFDVVLDCVGVPTFHAALRSARVGGKVVAIGNVVAGRVELNLGYAIVNGLHIVGSSGPTRAEMADVFALHRARPFTPNLEAVLPLERADEAQRRVRTGGLRGRIVLRP